MLVHEERENSETKTEKTELDPINHTIFINIRFNYIMLNLYSIRQHLTSVGKKDGLISNLGVSIIPDRRR